ncbi:unnamed protein product, partial [Ascophyllum nodosum]
LPTLRTARRSWIKFNSVSVQPTAVWSAKNKARAFTSIQHTRMNPLLLASSRSASMQIKDILEELRACIDDDKKHPNQELDRVVNAGQQQEFLKEIRIANSPEGVLKAKSVEDGRTLLLYAAWKGKHKWVKAFVERLWQSSATRERWRAPLEDFALVDRLRDVDERGAPLLFHAASNSKDTLELVKTVISNTLGEGGLIGQALSFDDKGRSMLMYAV